MRTVELTIPMGSKEMNEFRRMLGWARMFALGLFVAMSGVASFIVGGGPAWALVVTAAGAVVAALAWPKIRPFSWDADDTGVHGTLESTAA